MAKNITGFEFNEDPSSPKSKASAANLNKAISDALIKNIAPSVIVPLHLSGAVAGAGLGGGDGSPIYTKTDNETIEVQNDKLQLVDAPIIGTSKLVNGSITLEKLSTTLQETIQTLIKSIYKVGDIFITQNSDNPAERFGGTWQLVKDKFLIGAGGEYEILTEGGEASHTLTTDEMPSHNHSLRGSDGGTQCFCYYPGGDAIRGGDVFHAEQTTITATGGGQAHNNMPPYRAVYIWVKISDEDAE